MFNMRKFINYLLEIKQQQKIYQAKDHLGRNVLVRAV